MLPEIAAACHSSGALDDGGGWLSAGSIFLVGILGTIMPCTVQMGVVLASLIARPHGWQPPGPEPATGGPETRASVVASGGWPLRLAAFLGGYLTAFLATAAVIGALAAAGGAVAGAVVVGVAGGAVLAFLGLHLLGWVSLPGAGSCRGPLAFFLGRSYSAPPPPARLGATFAVYCAGCCGPSALGSALLLGQGTSFLAVGGLLLAYAAGMALPFLFLAGGLALSVRALRSVIRLTPVLTAVGGGLAVLAGALLIVRSLAGLANG